MSRLSKRDRTAQRYERGPSDGTHRDISHSIKPTQAESLKAKECDLKLDVCGPIRLSLPRERAQCGLQEAAYKVKKRDLRDSTSIY